MAERLRVFEFRGVLNLLGYGEDWLHGEVGVATASLEAFHLVCGKMAFLTLINCVLLTYAPLFVIMRTTVL